MKNDDTAHRLGKRLRAFASQLEFQAHVTDLPGREKEVTLANLKLVLEAAEFCEAMDPREKIPGIERTTALVLYFATPMDADNFASLCQQANPNLRSRKLP